MDRIDEISLNSVSTTRLEGGKPVRDWEANQPTADFGTGMVNESANATLPAKTDYEVVAEAKKAEAEEAKKKAQQGGVPSQSGHS